MAFEQTRDLVRKMRECRKEMGAIYAGLEPAVKDERVHMMLGYLKEHETHIAKCLEDMARTAPLFIMNTWFRFAPIEELHAHLAELKLGPDVDPEQLAHAAIDLDECMLMLMERTANESSAEGVREFFEELQGVGQHEHLKLVEAMRTFD